MLKHIFNLRNLLLVAALVTVIGIIVGQQGLLENTMAEYGEAVAENEAVNAERESLDAEKSDAEAGKGKEDAAREEGYVDDDEIVFVYD
jgi:cell division protein FtsB